MAAILFGSIGSLAETSELQRRAFNQAFEAHGLDWHWEREQYRKLLVYSGGQQRIAAFAQGRHVDAQAIHETKSLIFQELLTELGALPRAGVLETIRGAQKESLLLALVSATSPENITQLITALHPHIRAIDFTVIVDGSRLKHRKPAPDAYLYALKQLNLTAHDCIAIEDNGDGLTSAQSAGIGCVAFPGENTMDHDFSAALQVTDVLRFDEIKAMIPARRPL